VAPSSNVGNGATHGRGTRREASVLRESEGQLQMRLECTTVFKRKLLYDKGKLDGAREWAEARSASSSKMRVFCVRREVAAGGRDHPARNERRGTCELHHRSYYSEYLGVAGGRKKRAPILGTG
jgi:hypothetical protein